MPVSKSPAGAVRAVAVERSKAVQLLVILRIFSESTKVHHKQEHLKDDQRIRMGVITPHNPQCIADDKKYESRHTTLWLS